MYFDQNFSFLQVRTCQNFQKCDFTKIAHFLQVRTCQNFQKCAWTKISHFCRSGPVKISKNVILPKLLIFAAPDLSKFPKNDFAKISHFSRSGPVKISKNVLGLKFLILSGPDLSKFLKKYLDQNFSFLQVRTCQNFQKCAWTKISHFCRSGPVEIYKNVILPKFIVFAGPDLSKFPKKVL